MAKTQKERRKEATELYCDFLDYMANNDDKNLSLAFRKWVLRREQKAVKLAYEKDEENSKEVWESAKAHFLKDNNKKVRGGIDGYKDK